MGTDYIGKQIGNYNITNFLGRGHFAEVYLGYHNYLKMAAAIKILTNSFEQRNIDAFSNEAQIVANLQHRNIIRVFDFGLEPITNAFYFIMDHAPYGSLRDLHPQGNRVPLPTILSYVKQMAAALQYAHNSKLVHRDVKPANVLISKQNDLLLGDFGIVAIAHTTASLETIDQMGTPLYMAPELFAGNPRPASDQYALGAMVYEWLCGFPPFDGSPMQLMHQHMQVSPPSLREKVSTIDPAVERVVLQALKKDPHDRFESVQSFADVFEQVCFPHATIHPQHNPPQVIGEIGRIEVKSEQGHSFERYTVLDIGTTQTRAAIVEVRGDEKVMILGAGSCKQEDMAMAEGTISRIKNVIEACNKALLQAEEEAGGIIAPQAIVGVSFPDMHVVSHSFQKERSYSAKMITTEEFERTLLSALREVKDVAYARLGITVPTPNRQLQAIDFSLTDLRIDKMRAVNPIGFRGHELFFTLSVTFAPSEQIEAIETVARSLDLTLVAITTSIRSCASYLFRFQKRNHEALLFDVGGATTKIARIQRDQITSFRCFPYAGEKMTQGIALEEGLTFAEAEKRKRSLKKTTPLKKVIQASSQRWIEQAVMHLGSFEEKGPLPSNMYFLGGGIDLTEFRGAIEHYPWAKHLHFQQSPLCHFVDPLEKSLIHNAQKVVQNGGDITILANAYKAAFIGKQDDIQLLLGKLFAQLLL